MDGGSSPMDGFMRLPAQWERVKAGYACSRETVSQTAAQRRLRSCTDIT